MIRYSLSNQECEAKLNELGDTWRVLQQHCDFTALVASVDHATPRARERRSSPFFDRTDGARAADPATVNLSDEQMEFQTASALLACALAP